MRKEIKLEVMTEPAFAASKSFNKVLISLIVVVLSLGAVLTVKAFQDWETIQSYNDV